MELFVISLDSCAPALFEPFKFSFRGNIFSALWSKTLCVLSHSGWGQLLALEHCWKLRLPLRQARKSFCSATYFACCSILSFKNSTIPPSMTTFIQNARRKFRLILCFTSYLGIGCKNFGCFWLNCFLIFALELSKHDL